jgi:hypothetical protein
MPRSARIILISFAGWTLFVWGQRVSNVLGDEALDGGQVGARLALAGSFVLLALAVAVGSFLARETRPRWLDGAVKALAVWTVAVWAWRAVDIVTGDWSVAFVVVHLVLAVISVGLAVLGWRTVSRSTTSPDAPETDFVSQAD